MRILAIAPRTGSFPIGLSFVTASMKRAGYAVTTINLDLDPGYSVPPHTYDVVATGGLACHFQDVRRIASEARQGGAKVIVGGGLISADLEFMSEQIAADCFVTGEGERVILDLLELVRRGEALPRTIHGTPITDLDALPFPDYDAFGYRALIDKSKGSDTFFNDFLDRPRAYPIIASRSCPFRCTFCYSPLGTKYRQRSIRSVLDELREVVPKHRINIIQVMDELFSYDEERVREFCEGFTALARETPWELKWGCSLRVDGNLDEMLDLLRDSGCYWVQYGFESYSAPVLNSMRKKITPEQIHHAVHATLERKMSVQANFIFGDPAETPQTAEETLAFWRQHAWSGILLGHILPLPDSALFRMCLEKGLIADKLEYYERSIFSLRNMTSMTDVQYGELVGKVTLDSIRHTPTVTPREVTTDSMVVRCPCCSETVRYGNFSVESGCSLSHLYPVKPSRRFFYKTVYCRACRKMFIAASPAARLWFKLATLVYTPALNGLLRRLLELRQRRVQSVRSVRAPTDSRGATEV